MQKRSITLMKKIDTNIASILQQFQSIVELSAVLDKSQGTLAVEMLKIESNASTIVRLSEELLSITRNLKESWILGQLPAVADADTEGDVITTQNNNIKVNETLYDNMNQLLQLITTINPLENNDQTTTDNLQD
ncbi:hypothetical protein PACTADRAFT_48461 [Pachysolen tannophilus NRRL Y-2460]|uniref:Mediator of RNA polymerase II transcription subunit 22 n=1 Tax=Pachysolen tannophilus NRRL Y-2460 TaxID=669874 RepID=A0A1E4TXZ5_PACTA|nr:hypothetical protein PACTADRAFT_48461 [Pachysolen tannophilus NRRL Y-2460]